MITGWVLQRHKKTLSVVFGRLPFVFNVQAYLFLILLSVVLLWDVDTSRGLSSWLQSLYQDSVEQRLQADS